MKKFYLLSVIYRKLKNISLVKKVILVSVIAILLPSITMIFYTYNQSKSNFAIEIQKKDYQTLCQIKENMLLKVDTANNIASNLSLDYELQGFLKRVFVMNTENILEYIDHLIPKFIHTESFYRHLIDDVTIYTTNTSIPEQSDRLYHENEIIDLEWYTDFKNGKQDYLWLYPQNSLLFKKSGLQDESINFTLVKKIFSSGGNYLGIITITINEETLLPPAYTSDNTQEIFVLDKNLNIISHNNSINNADEIIKHKNNLMHDSGSNYLIDKNKLFTYITVEPLELSIISIKALDQLMEKPKDANRNVIIVLITGVFISVLFTVIIIQLIFTRLKKIIKIMDTISNGRFDILIPVEGEDEIGLLSKDFNRLITKINDQINELLKKETEQKNAQLLALQYQINPHFLYNTIEFFKAKMELAGEYQTAEAIVNFGEIFRYNISQNTMFATIKTEIHHVENYINIQKLRYNGQVILSINLPEEIMQMEIIKFTFQPIVENSIKHGITSSNQPLHINISSEVNGGNLLIIISDDGRGIDQDTLQHLNNSLRDSCGNDNILNSSSSIGLQNINHRLKLFYGNKYYIQLISEKGKYTSTIIVIPYIKN
ncbi:MAG: histidine kinase [Clostridiaceae bacterium]